MSNQHQQNPTKEDNDVSYPHLPINEETNATQKNSQTTQYSQQFLPLLLAKTAARESQTTQPVDKSEFDSTKAAARSSSLNPVITDATSHFLTSLTTVTSPQIPSHLAVPFNSNDASSARKTSGSSGDTSRNMSTSVSKAHGNKQNPRKLESPVEFLTNNPQISFNTSHFGSYGDQTYKGEAAAFCQPTSKQLSSPTLHSATQPSYARDVTSMQSSSLDNPKRKKDTLQPSGCVRLRCPARGMPLDHNSKNAYLVIPEDVRHGQDLFCSYTLCRNQGVKFCYCLYCKMPASKRSFGNRHLHQDKEREVKKHKKNKSEAKSFKKWAVASGDNNENARKQKDATFQETALRPKVTEKMTTLKDGTAVHNIDSLQVGESDDIAGSTSQAIQQNPTAPNALGHCSTTPKLKSASSKSSVESEHSSCNAELRKSLKQRWEALLYMRPPIDDCEAMSSWMEKVETISDLFSHTENASPLSTSIEVVTSSKLPISGLSSISSGEAKARGKNIKSSSSGPNTYEMNEASNEPNEALSCDSTYVGKRDDSSFTANVAIPQQITKIKIQTDVQAMVLEKKPLVSTKVRLKTDEKAPGPGNGTSEAQGIDKRPKNSHFTERTQQRANPAPPK